jgi:signal recognition particle subunit SEC65
LEFCILKHEGNYLDEELGITRRHYIDKEIAKKWRNDMQKIFHDDKNSKNEQYKKVSSKINKIYERMIGKA